MSNGYVISHRSHLLSISFQRELSNQIGYFHHGPQCNRSIRSLEQLVFLYFIFSFWGYYMGQNKYVSILSL